MHDFHDCPYCSEELEQWCLRFQRGDASQAHERHEQHKPWYEPDLPRGAGREESNRQGGVATAGVEGLTLLSLCPSERCGYYVLRYRNGLTHWDRDVEAARLLRTVFAV